MLSLEMTNAILFYSIKIVKIFIFVAVMRNVFILLAAFFAALSCSTPDERSAEALAERIVPGYDIKFVQIDDTLDVFEIQTIGARLVIKGNNANSMVVGLNHYLKNYCDVTVSWFAYDPVQYPSQMPAMAEPVRVEARTKERFFLNYCTFGYTMPWWKWEDWERFIDWMALNGVTMPLANTGMEAVWQKVWRKHGLTDEQIRAYFTGPAHLAWHRMNNIDKFDGPLPQGWIDSQVELQKKILDRERSLNMRPVLSAFNGHVPEQLKEIYPSAAITDIKGWGGFEKEYLCHFLSPLDSLYPVIQREFLTEQERLFGSDHIYGLDLFNEVEAPSWDPQTLAAMSKGAYESLATVDPDALWLQMGWLFYYDQKHWTKENVEAYLRAVPQDKVIILDYYLENTPVWKLTESFYGQPYILCYLGNFGGNTRLAGHFHQTSERIEDAFANGGENLYGLGSTLEGFGVNQFMFEYVLDKAWKYESDDAHWVETLADRRLGYESSVAREAWKSLTDSVYVGGSFSSQTPLMCARPCLEGFWHWTAIHNIKYDNKTLVRAWKQLLALDSDRDSYRFDIVNFGTQALGNHFAVLRDEFTAAYRAGDLAKAELVGAMMLELIDDIDALAACEPQLRLDRWLDDAAACASSAEEIPYYTRNARTIITIWGTHTNIRDYASRLWSGLVDSYCKPRWEMFIDEIISCIRDGREYDQDAFFQRLNAFEDAWASEEQYIDYRAPGDFKALSLAAIDKYGL